MSLKLDAPIKTTLAYKFSQSSPLNLDNFTVFIKINTLCSHKVATLMQFSYELLILSYESRLFLHPRHYSLGATYFHYQSLIVYDLLGLVVEGLPNKDLPA